MSKATSMLNEILGFDPDDGERLISPKDDDPIWDILKDLPARDYGPYGDDDQPFNRGYVGWGPYEDYMISKKGDQSWRSNIIRGTWDEFYAEMKGWDRDFNIVVDFYFSAEAEGHECTACEGSGLNPETKMLSDDWSSLDKQKWIDVDEGRRYNDFSWQYHLEEPEVEALVRGGRLWDVCKEACVIDNPGLKTKRYFFSDEDERWMGWIDGEKLEVVPPEYPTPEEVNEWSRQGMGHDGINRWICVKSRAKRLGVYGKCEHCGGDGTVRTGESKLALYMWLIHPRKGASRGVHIKDVPYDEKTMREVKEFLGQSRKRMTEIWKWVDTEI